MLDDACYDGAAAGGCDDAAFFFLAARVDAEGRSASDVVGVVESAASPEAMRAVGDAVGDVGNGDAAASPAATLEAEDGACVDDAEAELDAHDTFFLIDERVDADGRSTCGITGGGSLTSPVAGSKGDAAAAAAGAALAASAAVVCDDGGAVGAAFCCFLSLDFFLSTREMAASGAT